MTPALAVSCCHLGHSPICGPQHVVHEIQAGAATGPEAGQHTDVAGKQKRKTLRVRDPEKYRWRPQELLAELAHIYLHLSAADKQGGSFVAAIAADQRSYHEGLFSEAADVRRSEICVCAVLHAWLLSLLVCTLHTAWWVQYLVHPTAASIAIRADANHRPPTQVLRKYGLLSEEEVDAMEALGESVGLARLSAAQEEDVLGDVPDEFLDPLLGTVMRAREAALTARASALSGMSTRAAGMLLHKLLVDRSRLHWCAAAAAGLTRVSACPCPRTQSPCRAPR